MMIIIRAAISISILSLLFGCLDLSEDYLDVEYYTPQILPDENTIIIMKHVHEYRETGTPGGINTDLIASRWYLVEYKISDRSFNQRQLYVNNQGSIPRISSATDSYALLVTSYREFILKLSNLELTELSHDLDVKDAYLEIDNGHIKLLEGFLDYFIYTYNVTDKKFVGSIPLSAYYSRLAPSLVADPDYYLLWKMNEFAVIDSKLRIEKVYAGEVNHIVVYDINKTAILGDENQIDFYEVTSDTLLLENSLLLDHQKPVNFSISRSLNFLVYQTMRVPEDGEIVLRDMNSGTERIVLQNEHIEL